MNEQARTVAIIGGGVIGGGWAARCLLRGLDVNVFDPDPAAARKIDAVLTNARRAHVKQGLPEIDPGRLNFAPTLEAAVAAADFVQENTPEIEDLKKTVVAEIAQHCRPETIIASSTSGLLPSRLQADCERPERFVVGHPFNPVYLLPLVEICGGENTSQASKDRADLFYRSIGMRPLHVRKEIDGFVADRLMEALWREALHLVNDGVATTADVDDAIIYGAGMRWAFMGPFLTFWLAGGEGGMRHFMQQFGPALKLPWTKLDAPELTDELLDKIVEQSDRQTAGQDLRSLEALRDDCLIDIMESLARHDYAAGAELKKQRQA